MASLGRTHCFPKDLLTRHATPDVTPHPVHRGEVLFDIGAEGSLSVHRG